MGAPLTPDCVLYAATGDEIVRMDEAADGWTAERSLWASGAQCLAVDPADPDVVYAGLRTAGVRRSVDGGQSWADCELPEPGVFSLAVSAADGALYPAPSRAGCSGAMTEARAGASWQRCSTCPQGRAGASRRARGPHTCAGSHPARTTRTCSWSGSSWAA